ncbi:uncharacterized protein AMSG_09471 [Thecamonas trahens ATCC 50062]|uniref:BED-type domain-containing protein n=1 Tax=Thecamonas trahens ATCC 50062 TaxID=461836 RepID=A0A0L0DNC2_THETB|nr:hypothetical protein AMSG_09471 [Thecamonas trahens ATCC 50062]KNC53755.1 hypothetical protein AMSG_09471 [Thecamonas trahens ATCC 50062]|eukprot:XP_013754318.1 hypothetical protein AMSG_09471 [Thecamonas trahens ATCC 50062]
MTGDVLRNLRVRSQSKPSVYWSVVYEDEGGEDGKFRCMLCGVQVTASHGKTSNIANHMKLQHRSLIQRLAKAVGPETSSQPSITQSLGTLSGKSLAARKRATAPAAVKFVLSSHSPFRIMDNPDMHAMVAAASRLSVEQIKQVLPSAYQVAGPGLDALFERCRQSVVNLTKSGPVVLYVDEWTSKATHKSFLGMCASFYNNDGERVTVPVAFRALTPETMLAIQETGKVIRHLGSVAEPCPELIMQDNMLDLVGDKLVDNFSDTEGDDVGSDTEPMEANSSDPTPGPFSGADLSAPAPVAPVAKRKNPGATNDDVPLDDLLLSDLPNAPLDGRPDPLSKARRIVALVQRSSKVKRYLDHIIDKKEHLEQEEYNIEVSKYKGLVQGGLAHKVAPPIMPRRRPRSLRPSVVTRWGSTVAMLNRMLDMREDIDELCSMPEVSVEKLSDDDWAQLKLAYPVLSMIDMASTRSQREDNRPSDAIVTMLHMRSGMQEIISVQASGAGTAALKAIGSELKYFAEQDTSLFAFLIDPEVTHEQLREFYGCYAKALYGDRTTDTLIQRVRRDVWGRFASKIAVAFHDQLARTENEPVPEVVDIAFAPDDAPRRASASANNISAGSSGVSECGTESSRCDEVVDLILQKYKRQLEATTGSRVGSKKPRTAFAQQASNRPSATLLIESYSKALTQAIFDYKNIGVTMSPDARIQLIPALARTKCRFGDDQRIFDLMEAATALLRPLLLPSAAAASVERLNSVGTDMLTRKRNRLDSERIEKMVLTRCWIAASTKLGIDL